MGLLYIVIALSGIMAQAQQLLTQATKWDQRQHKTSVISWGSMVAGNAHEADTTYLLWPKQYGLWS